jgi:uncharacterized membrane protein
MNVRFQSLRRPRFGRDERGSVAVILAFALPAIVGVAALSVDVGSVYLATRRLQGVADLAAMAAARNPSSAQTAATATVADNAFDAAVSTQVVTGQYVPDPTVPAAQRFQAGGASPTAAQVTLTTQTPLFFGAFLIGKNNVTISRSATAAQAQMASFQIGTSLVSLQGGVANSLLSTLTGSTVSLSAMDYNALASANVDLFQYMAALKTRLSLQTASFSSVLQMNVTPSVALSALSDALNSDGATEAAAAAAALAQASGSAPPLALGDLFDLGPYSNQDHVSSGSGTGVSIGALDFVSATLTAAQGGRQLALNLSGTVPGLSSVTAFLAIGQRQIGSPWIGIDNAQNVTVSTAETRLYIDSKVAPTSSLLSPLGVSLLDVPVYVEIAQGKARLSSITCGATPSDEAVTLSVDPSVGQVTLGSVNTATLNNFSQPETPSPAVLLNLLLIQATAASTVNLGGLVWQPVQFNASDIAGGTVKSVQTDDIAVATVTSLFANTQVSVQLAGLGLLIGAGPATNAVQSTLTSVAAPLDQTLDGLESLLGVKLGEADVKINGVRCQGAALVA